MDHRPRLHLVMHILLLRTMLLALPMLATCTTHVRTCVHTPIALLVCIVPVPLRLSLLRFHGHHRTTTWCGVGCLAFRVSPMPPRLSYPQVQEYIPSVCGDGPLWWQELQGLLALHELQIPRGHDLFVMLAGLIDCFTFQ